MRMYRIESKKGFTLLETVIAIAISSIVMATVATVYYLSVRTIKDLYAPTYARTLRSKAISQIRFRLCDAKIGSCVVSDNNHRIRFRDPNLARNGTPVISEFYFDPVKKILYYDDDISTSEAFKVAKGPVDITFTLGSKSLDLPNNQVPMGVNAIVSVVVKSASKLSYSKVDVREGETVIYLRNI
jgi:prepilin-type N-terminal cleavage/methylation domain-containing protein